MFACLKNKKSILSLMIVMLLALSACSLLPGSDTAAPAEPVEAVEPPAQEEAAPEEPAPAPAEEEPQTEQAAPAAANALDGSWANEDPEAPGITRMTFRTEGGALFVQMWTHCDEGECEWQEQQVPAASPLEVTWKTPVATNLQTITLLEDGRLQVDEQLSFTDGSGRGDVGLTSYLVKQ